jgi:hypothetical protein
MPHQQRQANLSGAFHRTVMLYQTSNELTKMLFVTKRNNTHLGTVVLLTKNVNETIQQEQSYQKKLKQEMAIHVCEEGIIKKLEIHDLPGQSKMKVKWSIEDTIINRRGH